MTLDISALKIAIPYIRAYKNKIFIIKLGGEVCQPGETLENVAAQIGLFYQLGIKVIVVHGGGSQATELAERLGVESKFVDGRRVTSAEMLEVTKMTFAGTINTDVVAAFKGQHVPAIGMTGIDGELFKVTRRSPANDPSKKGLDYGFVGDITSVNVTVLQHLLAGDYLPVICSLAADDEGQVLNVNADTVAASIAKAMQATKYCLVSNVDGVLRDPKNPNTLISALDMKGIRQLIDDGIISGGMLPKVNTCLEAIQAGVPRAHIVNGLQPDTLLREIFTNEGCGTLIVKSLE